jgi:uncharacterized membrane protein
MTEQSAELSTPIACSACGRSTPVVDITSYRLLRDAIADELTGNAGHAFAAADPVCRSCVNAAQRAYVTARLTAERGELTALETEIARKAADHAAIAAHIDDLFARKTSRGQRIADAVARVGGSWGFVITFVSILLVWMMFNTWLLAGHAFDPYPYILLNLLLSCVAALQAPVIMMSQNRTSARDRMQADQDFRINLKAELEIASLHEKLDHLLHTRWENLIEIQEEQVELLRGLAEANLAAKPTLP